MDSLYTLIRSSRRTLSIQIGKDGELIARAPMRMSVRRIDVFIEQKKDWIEKHQGRVKGEEGRAKKNTYSSNEIREMKVLLKEYIIPRVRELSEGKNLPQYISIKITTSEGRWGSCSARNGLCFSYRLAEYLENPPGQGGCPIGQGGFIFEQTPLSPPLTGGHRNDFIDAVIIHELAHLREKNHQKPFWNLVYNWMPEYETIMKDYKNLSDI